MVQKIFCFNCGKYTTHDSGGCNECGTISKNNFGKNFITTLCSYCNKPIRNDHWTFCPYCGNNIIKTSNPWIDV